MLATTEHKPVEFTREHLVFSSRLTAWFLYSQSCMFCLLYMHHQVLLIISSVDQQPAWLSQPVFALSLLTVCLSFRLFSFRTKLIASGLITLCLSSKHRAAFTSLPAQKTCQYSKWKNWDSICNKHKAWIRDVYLLPHGQKGEWKMKSKQFFFTIFNQAELLLSCLIDGN